MEKNKFTKKKKAVVLIGCLLIVVVAAVVVWSIRMSKKDEGKSDSDSKETGYHELKDGENEFQSVHLYSILSILTY